MKKAQHGTAKQNTVPRWGIKLAYRLAQKKAVGTYTLKIKVSDDGARYVSIDGGRWEKL